MLKASSQGDAESQQLPSWLKASGWLYVT